MTLILNKQAVEMAKPFQVEDAAFVVQHNCVMLGHKTGMGKSLIGLMAWAQWADIERVLILGGKSAATTWNTQPMIWADTQITFLDGPKRDSIWHECIHAPSGIWYTTYDMFRRYMEKEPKRNPSWDLIICDEAHKLRNRRTLAYRQMLRVDFRKLIGMSATWSSRGPQDLYALLHLIAPKQFSSYWRFVHTYCYVEDTGFGKEIFGVRNKVELQKRMNSAFYRSQTWENIGMQFPPVRREVVEVSMTPEQERAYNALDSEMFAAYDGTQVVTPTRLSLGTRLHQLAVLPQLLFPTMGPGGALEHIVECIEDDPHTVIYTYFAEGIPLIMSALRIKGHHNIFTLRGGTNMKQVDAAVMGWKFTRGIMICSIRFAESFRIDTSHTAYVLGFSWDPNDNIQAEGRLRAIDSPVKSPVLVKYYIVRRTIVESVKDVTNEKARTVSQIFNDYAIFRRQQV